MIHPMHKDIKKNPKWNFAPNQVELGIESVEETKQW